MKNYVKEMELAAKKRDLPIFFPRNFVNGLFLRIFSADIFV